MVNIRNFSEGLASEDLSELDRAIGLIWLLTEIEARKDCTVNEIVDFLDEQQFTRPNVSRLYTKLCSSSSTVKGSRPKSFRISRIKLKDVEQKFEPIFHVKKLPQREDVLPMDWLNESKRKYLIEMGKQINGTYELTYYDATAILARRMMESLIIEVYIISKREQEIKKNDGSFQGLDVLIGKINSDFSMSKNSLGYMNKIKDAGDTAAHHRSYITKVHDIETSAIRKVIHELLLKAGLNT